MLSVCGFNFMRANFWKGSFKELCEHILSTGLLLYMPCKILKGLDELDVALRKGQAQC